MNQEHTLNGPERCERYRASLVPKIVDLLRHSDSVWTQRSLAEELEIDVSHVSAAMSMLSLTGDWESVDAKAKASLSAGRPTKTYQWKQA